MFNLLTHKGRFKRIKVKKLQEKIWDYRIAIEAQRDFYLKAKSNKESLKRRIEDEKRFIEELAASTKYEDREKRKKEEEKLNRFQSILQAQENEIKKAENIIDNLSDEIQKMNSLIEATKGLK